MALAELLRSLEEEGDAKVQALLAQAHAAAGDIRAARAADLLRRREAAGEARARELEAAAAREIEAAGREAARKLLEARADALERVRRRVEERLAAGASDPAGVPALTRDLALALEYVGPVSAVVEAPAPLLDALRDSVRSEARLTFVPSSNGGSGVRVRTSDGTLAVDASGEHRLARAWPRLVIELAARLEALP